MQVIRQRYKETLIIALFDESKEMQFVQCNCKDQQSHTYVFDLTKH